ASAGCTISAGTTHAPSSSSSVRSSWRARTRPSRSTWATPTTAAVTRATPSVSIATRSPARRIRRRSSASRTRSAASKAPPGPRAPAFSACMRRLPVFPRRAAVSIAAALLTVGCATHAPRLRPTTAGALLDTLAARRTAVTSLRSRARLRSGLSGVWIREALLVRRPDAVRVDVLSPFGLALAVGVRGDLLWAYPAAKGTRYEGPATPANMVRVLGTPVAVADVVDVLLGVPPARDAIGPPLLAATREGEYRLVLPLADGPQAIWFAGDQLRRRRGG